MALRILSIMVTVIGAAAMQMKSNVTNVLSPFLLQKGDECPDEEHPVVLFNHVSKTGGTAVSHMLSALVQDGYFEIEEDVYDISIKPTDKKKSYVIGLVRRPCDYLVSWFYETDNPGKVDFKDWVQDVNDGVANVEHVTKATEKRYGKGDENLHCAVRTHNMKADFVACLNKYISCGGLIRERVKDEGGIDAVIDAALEQAKKDAHSNGRLVGEHPPCKSLFDDAMVKSVLKSEQAYIDKFDLGQCCS